MALTNKHILDLDAVLKPLEHSKELSIKFSYAIMRNKKKMVDLVTTFNKLREPCSEFVKYEEARVAACEKYATLDEAGKPVVVDGKYSFTDFNMKELNTEIETLKETDNFAVAKTKMEAVDKEIMDLLGEESDIDLHKVSVEFLPDSLSPKELEIVECMIAE